MRNLRIFAALFLAFGSLFFVSPAKAQTIQFTYYWTNHEFTFTDAQVTVVVTNNVTNTIGGGVTADSYRISVNNSVVVQSSEIHDARTYVFNLYGTQTLKLEGIDNGYWGGYYGPIMEINSSPLAAEPSPAPTESPSVSSESPTPTESPSVSTASSESETTSPAPETTSSPESQTESPSVSEEVTQSPSTAPSVSPEPSTSSPPTWDFIINEGGVLEAAAPTNMVFSGVVARYVAHDTDCGIDVSQIVGAVFIGTNMASISADNGVFGDPCPGWYKKLTVAFTYVSDPSSVPTQSPTVSPEPTPTPTPEPTPTPQPEPQPTLTPTPEPTPEPTPTPTPSPEPTPEPTQPQPVEPSPPVDPTPEPEPTPVEPEPTPSPEPEPSPTTTPEPTPTEQPQPEPSKPAQPSPTPSPSPEEPKPAPTPIPEPTPNPEPTPVPAPSVPPVAEVLENVANVDPTTLTETQVAELKEAALATFETAEPGSEEYEAALDALLIAAQADDIVIDEELASAPVIGAAVVAIADALNVLGNAGADMSPQVREQSEKVVIAAVIVGQVAMTATAAATSAAAAAARRP